MWNANEPDGRECGTSINDALQGGDGNEKAKGSHGELSLGVERCVLITLFERVGLLTNTSKKKAETCMDGNICTRLSKEPYFRSRAGFATQKDWDTRRVECNICGVELSANSLTSHLVTQHDVYQSKVIIVGISWWSVSR